eukprot:833655-Prymnesium_polylepis.1
MALIALCAREDAPRSGHRVPVSCREAFARSYCRRAFALFASHNTVQIRVLEIALRSQGSTCGP